MILLIGIIISALGFGTGPGGPAPSTIATVNDYTAAEPAADTIPGVVPNVPSGIVDTLRHSESSRMTDRDSISLKPDSLHARKDSLTKSDTSWVVYRDSTARIAQFVHHRSDSPSAEFFPDDNYPLYAKGRVPVFNRDVTIDSLGEKVTVRQKVNGADVKVPTAMGLKEYIHLRFGEERKKSWRLLAREYKYKETRDELGGLLGNFTNIEIPVPANPLLDIFGGKGIHLNVSGAVDIRAAYRNQSSDQVTLSTIDQSQSTPDFNQDVQINVNGTIGDKLKILADWNTQRTFEYENQLHINYTGYDDEIVQSVEAGNVSLSTPSLVSGGQALFGIKAKLQAGPLTLTTLLSQKKGQSQSISLTGGSRTATLDIYPYNYVQNYFFVDTIYGHFWEPLHKSLQPTITAEIDSNQILSIDVWQSIQQQTTTTAGIALEKKAYVDLPPHYLGQPYTPGFANDLDTSQNAGRYYTGYWVRLDPTKDYRFDPYGGYVILNNMSDGLAYAVSYTVLGRPDNKGKYFTKVFGDTIPGGGVGYLKLIRMPYLESHPEYTIPWKLMLKNIYSLNGRNIAQAGFDLKVARLTNGPEVYQILNANLLEVLGLDRYNQANIEQPDGAFDFLNGLTINVDRGEILFPSLRPFDTGIKDYFHIYKAIDDVPDSLLYPQVYDTTASAAQNLTIVNKYIMHIHSSQGQSNTFPLGFNVVEGSVQVLLNGQAMVPNVDYSVDYILGQVTIRNQQALAPGANLQVKYEQNDLFQLASKTMIGVRGETQNILPNTNFGFTIMNLNQATLSDKVRVGEEPTNNTIMGIDGSTGFDLPFLTSAIDALPFIRTREMSSFHINGEAAMILPNPNTSQSSILSDNGASVAYLDDFEGARRTIPLPVVYTAWHLSSPPITVPITGIPNGVVPDTVLQHGDTATIRTYMKAKLNWYNNSTCYDPVTVTEVYAGRKQVHTNEQFLSVLGMNYDPNHRGMYNYSPNLATTLHRQGGPADNDSLRRYNWGGVQQFVSNTGNLLDQNIAYLEIWLRSASDEPADLLKGRFHIDIGRISEDVIPNGRVNSEDLIFCQDNKTGLPRGVITPSQQDFGLDTLNDAQEKVRFASFLADNRNDPDVNPDDPSGDDWQYQTCSADLTHLNGSEGNAIGPTGNRPDTEDLNSNGVVDNDNEYLEYNIPLDSVYEDSPNHIVQNSYIVGAGGNKWRQFRIPLIDAAQLIGGGTSKEDILQNVQYIRMWFSGFSSPVNLKIAEMNFVGNQWQTRIPNDSILQPTTVSIEDNPDYATPDYNALGITRPRDKTDPNQIIAGNEQSLALDIKGLQRGDSHHVFRSFAVRPLDLFNYREMKMFVHSDTKFAYYAPDRYDAEVFLRFGADTQNYYEYRTPVKPGWNPDNQITIPFSELTAIKAIRDSASLDNAFPVPGNRIGATYRVKGNPSLRQIREIMIGVTNPPLQGGTAPLVGQIWVNELRLTNVNNEKGYAYHFDTQLKLADLGSVGFNYSYSDPNFHGLSDAFGSQNTSVNWAVNSNVSLDRYFPPEWQGTSLGFGYSHSESMVKPKYLPNSDVVVTAAAAEVAQTDKTKADQLITSSQTLQVQDSYSIPNFHIALPSQLWYIRDTFSKLAFSFSYNTAHARDPSTISRTNWQWGFRASYGVQLPQDAYIQPFKNIFKGLFLFDDLKDWKFYYEPIQSFTANMSASRSRAFQLTSYPGSIPTSTRSFGASKSMGFNWKLTEGGLTNLSGDYALSIDRNLYNLDNDTSGRGFGSILKNMIFGGVDGHYSQRITVNSKPKVLNIFDLPRYLDLNAGYNVNYNWQNTFAPYDIGKSAGFDNGIALNLNFRLKALTDPWFASFDKPSGVDQPQKSQDQQSKAKDTTAAKTDAKSGSKGNSFDLLSGLKTAAKMFIKIPFLDYENIGISFSQSNHVASSGVPGSTGFMNFWGRWPFMGSLDQDGPSRLYQLGLISDPTGSLVFSPHSSFPFLAWRVQPGLRAHFPDNTTQAQLADQYGQSNSIALKTNRPLWTGASLDVNWKVAWQYSRNTTITTDSLGNPTPGVVTTGGSVERSYLSFPSILMFKVFKSNLEDVGKKYQEYIHTMTPGEALTQSFEKGMEALPFLNKVFGQYVPRPNWSLRWDGIEKIAGLSSVFDKLSLEHSYSSSFRRDFRGDPNGNEITDVERITYGFAPLAGVTASFKEFFKGTLSGSLRYNTTSTLDLNTTASNIVETYSQEMAISITYGRHGFKFPLFGLNLTNDIDFTMTFSETRNSRQSYDPNLLADNPDGTPLEGNTRMLIEPQIRYDLSSRVRASVFYRYQRVAPDENASLIYGTTTNEAGLEIHITI